jgi:fructokinase
MICVIGEVLIDVVEQSTGGTVTRSSHAGGSPFNVAVGLARLGSAAQLAARFSTDEHGSMLRETASSNGVDLSLSVTAEEPSTIAIARLDDANNARYEFRADGTADWQWTADELAQVPGDNTWVHTGSLTCLLEPGASTILTRLEAIKAEGGRTISFDPNMRPTLFDDRARARELTEAFVRVADYVKASSEDIAWLYPEDSVEEVMARWRGFGPSAVAVTHAGDAVRLLAEGSVESHPTPSITVVDTIGAGDSFMAAWIDALSRGESAADATRWAIAASAITCQRAGANPPTSDEVRESLGLTT